MIRKTAVSSHTHTHTDVSTGSRVSISAAKPRVHRKTVHVSIKPKSKCAACTLCLRMHVSVCVRISRRHCRRHTCMCAFWYATRRKLTHPLVMKSARMCWFFFARTSLEKMTRDVRSCAWCRLHLSRATYGVRGFTVNHSGVVCHRADSVYAWPTFGL